MWGDVGRSGEITHLKMRMVKAVRTDAGDEALLRVWNVAQKNESRYLPRVTKGRCHVSTRGGKEGERVEVPVRAMENASGRDLDLPLVPRGRREKVMEGGEIMGRSRAPAEVGRDLDLPLVRLDHRSWINALCVPWRARRLDPHRVLAVCVCGAVLDPNHLGVGTV